MTASLRYLFAMSFLFCVVATCHSAEAPLVITHVNVVDVIKGAIQRDMIIVIRAGKISEARPAHREKKVPAGATILSAAGKFLIPGLWDMHAHIQNPARDFNLFVANGVLGVRNMGGIAKDIFRWREQVETGELAGPRILACGPIVDGPNPTNPPISVSVDTAQSGRRLAQSLKAMGADFIKVHDGVPREAYFAIADEAKNLNLPLVGHVPVRVRTHDATNAGQRSIEHQIGLRGTSMAEDEVMQAEQKDDIFAEAMRTKNFRLIPESIARKGNLLLDQFSERRAQELYRAFARNGTYLTPTLVTQRSLTFVDDISRQEDARAKYFPAAMREQWKPENGMLTRYRTPAYIAYRKREYAKTLEQISVAHRAGVMFLAGTDMSLPYIFSGFSVHDELELFVKAGLTPMQALQTATINPVKLLEWEDSAGSIQPRKTADLVLLDADPTQDISNIKKISAVVLRGKLLRRADLDQMLLAAEAANKQ